jgi:enoyl-CoA hydratase
MYQSIIVETHDRTGLIRFNRPNQLNALNDQLMDELGDALVAFDRDEAIAAIVVTGSDKAFAAGADIGGMKDLTFMDVYRADFLGRNWEMFRRIRKPLIAAVNGFALGGGCEVAMMCDIIVAGDSARFGQPEVKIGILPGAGGTQRLPRAVGKAKAMDMVLTGRMMGAAEAERCGLVSRVVPAAETVATALAIAAEIAALPGPAVMLCKEAVNRSFESPLAEGLMFERRMFHALFGTPDQREGMAAFVEKRKPLFPGR